jgi:two-component system, NarL family, sensor histidine kinase LiaS
VENTQFHRIHRPEPELTVAMLACELHDGACQQLVAASSHLEAFRHLFSEDPEGAWKEYEVGMSRLRRGLGELRALISGLRPMQLEGRNLDAAIASLVRQCSTEHQVTVHFSKKPEDFQFPAQLLITGFRIIQEALINVCRHSGSRATRVDIVQGQGEVRISIEDWGAGFDPAEVPPSCFGLAGIRARAESVGGTALLVSRPGAGTLVTVSLPLLNTERE